MTNLQFERTRRLALQSAGIDLQERHRELLERKGRRRGLRDRTGVESLLAGAEAGEREACRQFIGLITTHFTGFFRHAEQFEVAARHLLSVGQHGSQARVWSAAAATGEEPYSLALAWLESAPTGAPPVRILATDIDEESLALAQQGEFGEPARRALSPALAARWFEAGGLPDRRRIVSAARDLVEFRPLNLIDLTWPVSGPLDVIFCRNVLMYLETFHRYAVLERMASLLAPDGFLVLDPSEHLGSARHLFESAAVGIYRRRPLDRSNFRKPHLNHPSALIRPAACFSLPFANAVGAENDRPLKTLLGEIRA